MNHYNLFFYSLLISAAYILQPALALNGEGIVGGFLGNYKAFRYAVLIQGRVNFSEVYENICTGVAIDAYFAFSAAQCFVDENNALIPKSYSLLVGAHAEINDDYFRVNIVTIHLPGFDAAFDSFNFALLKLNKNIQKFFDLSYEMGHSSILLPKFNSFYEVTKTAVYGYGVTTRDPVKQKQEQLKVKEDGKIVHELRFADVKVLGRDECQNFYPNVNHDHQMCGKMINDGWGRKEQFWGACKGDNGAPLVNILGEVIGILGKTSVDCDDENNSSLYTRVAVFSEFIRLVMKGRRLPDGTYVHQNLAHTI